ncbi:glutathione S-transferase [Thozetella sp. PMI_491]|nr:glutathione S-transferase [Thozetella sp. PMI_491]
MQPIKLYNAPPGSGPNPWKVLLVLCELEIPYEMVWIPYSEIKSEPYISLNPNGRLPAVIDPNKDVTLFESGAIIEYLVATYDKEHKITYGDDRLQDKWLVHSWLMFQMSGQGPMFGQRMWFVHFHKEKELTSAIERYGDETKRVLGVIDRSLQKQRATLNLGPDAEVWLVGDKCTVADLSFVFWDVLLFSSLFPEGHNVETEYPEFYKWHTNTLKRPVVSQIVEMREECRRTMPDTAAAVLPKRN